MNRFKEDEIVPENSAQPANDGIDRRNFLGCMAWAGTGLLWTMAGGVPTSRLLAQVSEKWHSRCWKDRGFLVRANQR